MRDITIRGVIERGDGGVATSGGRQLIQIADGDFTTGYKIKEFRIFAYPDAETGHDAYGLVSTLPEPKNVVDGGDWDWSDNSQVAWATTSYSGSGATVSEFTLVDPDNILIENFYVWMRFGGGGSAINFYLRLEPVEQTEAMAAINMVKQYSQGGSKRIA